MHSGLQIGSLSDKEPVNSSDISDSIMVTNEGIQPPLLDGGFFDDSRLHAEENSSRHNEPPIGLGDAFLDHPVIQKAYPERDDNEVQDVNIDAVPYLLPVEMYEGRELDFDLDHRLEAELRTIPFKEFVQSLRERVERNEISISEMELLIQQMSLDAFVDDIDRKKDMNNYLDAEVFSAYVKDLVYEYAYPDGAEMPIPLPQLLHRLSVNYGQVFTTHPTFALNYKLMHLFQDIANGKKDVSAVASSEILPQHAINLPLENSITMEACLATQEAFTQIRREIYLHIADIYSPEEIAQAGPLNLGTLAVWPYGDIDGRTDVLPKDAWSALKLRQKLFTASALSMLRENLGDSDIYTQLAHIPEGAKHADFKQLLATTEQCIAEYSRKLEAIEDTEKDAELVKKLSAQLIDACSFRDQLYSTGLSITRVHFRTNSKNLANAEPIDLNITHDPQDPSFYPNVIPHLENVAQHRSENLMILARGIKDEIDPHTPIRYLIAETQGPEPVLQALQFAETHGVDDIVDISPLFEDENGIDRAIETMKVLLKDPRYRAYVKRRGRITIQVGQSDSGRYLGQPASGFELDNLFNGLNGMLEEFTADYMQHQLHKLLADDDELAGLEVLVFTTGGEATGRGAPDRIIEDRVSYHIPPRNRFAHYSYETAFQGQGMGYYHSPEMARSTMLAINHELNRELDADELEDPLYLEENMDFVKAFSRSVRSFNQHMRNLPNYSYGEMISLLNMLGMTYGSRKKVRSADSDSGAEREDPITQIRAIGHTNRLQILAMFLTAFAGVGFGEDSNTFHDTLIELSKKSPRMKLVMDMIIDSFDYSFLDVFLEKIETVNPDRYADVDERGIMKQYFNYEDAQDAVEAVTDEYHRMSQIIEEYRALEVDDDRVTDEQREKLYLAQAINTTLIQLYLSKVLQNQKWFSDEQLSVFLNFDLGCSASELRQRLATIHQAMQPFSLNGSESAEKAFAEINVLYRLVQRSVSLINSLHPALG